jgi:hypothetical protein
MTTIDFYLAGLSAALTLTTKGTLDAQAADALTADATAIFNINIADMAAVFKFQSDSNDFTDAAAEDVKYYVYSANSELLKLNPAHAKVVTGAQIPGATATTNLVKHDYLRFLAKDLFNTVHGVDLFNNEAALLSNVAFAGNEIMTTNNTRLTNISVTGTTSTGPDNAHYMTNDTSSNLNICRVIMREIALRKPARFTASAGDTDISGIRSVPFVVGDTFSFKITVNADAEQHTIVRASGAVATRTYLIQLVLVNGTGNGDKTVVQEVDAYQLNYPYSSA